MWPVWSMLCVMAVVPLTFHNEYKIVLLLAAVSSTFSHVDVSQHVKTCLKLQARSKKWTRCEGQRLFSVIQHLLPPSIPIHVCRNWMRLTPALRKKAKETGKTTSEEKTRRREEKREEKTRRREDGSFLIPRVVVPGRSH